VYERDRALLLKNKIKITGALSTLSEVRGFDNPYAWHTYYVDHYNAEVQAIPGYHLFVVEPLKRRFSLRLANVDPIFLAKSAIAKTAPSWAARIVISGTPVVLIACPVTGPPTS
jgi:hypothetical protein